MKKNTYIMNKLKSFAKQRKLGFSFIEIILVLMLISFLYTVTTKVIQHNLEQKIPLYVYNLYKNLENESKLLTKKLLEEANDAEDGGSSSGETGTSGSDSSPSTNKKTIEEVLKGLSAKKYCEAFAKDINIIGGIGDVDCENSSLNFQTGQSVSKKYKYGCERSYSFNVDNNKELKYKETFTPSYNEQFSDCSNSTNTDETVYCNATPKNLISNLMKPNTENKFTYQCTKISGDDGSDEPVKTISYDLNSIVQIMSLKNVIKSLNNIHFRFVSIAPSVQNEITYNLKATVYQDAICPRPVDATFSATGSFIPALISNTNNCSSYENCLNSRINTSGNGYGSSAGVRTNRHQGAVFCMKGASSLYKAKFENNTVSTNGSIKMGFCKGKFSTDCWDEFPGDTVLSYTLPKITNETCENYLTYTQKSTSFNSENNTYTHTKIPGTSYVGGTSGGYTAYCYMLLKQDITMKNRNAIYAYYDLWNTFFTKNPSFIKQTKKPVDLSEQDEGSVQSKGSGNNNYITHFIYASIDIPFAKGEMNKNIFVFEQFGNKIIPVGYLANDENSPLKFNVIKRDNVTKKITRLNTKPLNFCEAMKYTGDKFSQYCGCKDESNNIVTQFNKIDDCKNNFGCRIQPIQPASSKPNHLW